MTKHKPVLKKSGGIKTTANATSRLSCAWWMVIGGTCLLLWVGHAVYLSHLFENVRFFSHLADFEREMAYRTEMGLYFSYYKTIVLAVSFRDGLHEIMNDNVTEYGHTINTLQRFNLYPEIILAGAYRLFKQLAEWRKWQTESCWLVNRGEGLPPVQSCEGVGNLHYFYVYGVFGLAGSVPASLFMSGVILSGSYWGGVVSSAAFLFNHGEATRVAWTPPLRESFAYPIFMAQVTLLSAVLKTNSFGRFRFMLFTALTTLTILFWQLSAFVFATQLGAIFAAFLFNTVDARLLFSLWKSYALAFVVSLAFLFGNPMLINSLFATSLVGYLVVLGLDRVLLSSSLTAFRPTHVAVLANVYLACVFGGKLVATALLDIRDDGHVMELLRAKFDDESATFHTRLYTCAPEFDFISVEWFMKLTITLLLPTVSVVLTLIIVHLCRRQLFSTSFWWRTANANDDGGIPSIEIPSAELIYNVVQTACFMVMAALIMRLKLFATPHLCIVAAAMASKSLLTSAIGKRLAKLSVPLVVALLAAMAVQGRLNIAEQLAMRGEYNNPEQEHLFEWIKRETAPDAVFAGTMPVMANVKLSTLRPIVNHPHYENEEVRNRTLIVYAMYSRKPMNEVHRALVALHVDYYIFQQSSCVDSHPDLRCTYAAMWDLADPANRGRQSPCVRIVEAAAGRDDAQRDVSPFFSVAYRSHSYIVLRVGRL